jgi:hypothetical protein
LSAASLKLGKIQDFERHWRAIWKSPSDVQVLYRLQSHEILTSSQLWSLTFPLGSLYCLPTIQLSFKVGNSLTFIISYISFLNGIRLKLFLQEGLRIPSLRWREENNLIQLLETFDRWIANFLDVQRNYPNELKKWASQ